MTNTLVKPDYFVSGKDYPEDKEEIKKSLGAHGVEVIKDYLNITSREVSNIMSFITERDLDITSIEEVEVYNFKVDVLPKYQDGRHGELFIEKATGRKLRILGQKDGFFVLVDKDGNLGKIPTISNKENIRTSLVPLQ